MPIIEPVQKHKDNTKQNIYAETLKRLNKKQIMMMMMMMMMMMVAIAIIIKIIINVRWPSGGPICTFCSTHMITCCGTETRSINTARASSVWRKCPGSWCVRLTHV